MPTARFPAFFEAIVPPCTRPPPKVSPPDGRSAPTWVDSTPTIEEGHALVQIDVEEAVKEGESGPLPAGDGEMFSAEGWSGTDAIAIYCDWHRYRSHWGIYFFQRPFLGFVHQLAQEANIPAGTLAPVALRQLLFHELAHFEFEVVGTEVEDMLGQPDLYETYLSRRVRQQTPWTPAGAALEEALATWREVSFARRRWPKGMRPLGRGYQAAAEHLASLAPPGYQQWDKAAEVDQRRQMTAHLVSLLAGRSVSTYRWGRLEPRERAEVPRFWLGDPALIPAIGAKQLRRPAPVPGFLLARARTGDQKSGLSSSGSVA